MNNRILYVKWDSYLKDDIGKTIEKIFGSVDTVDITIDGYRINEKHNKLVSSKICNNNYNVVISVNYIPEISNICEERNVKYVSWIYDAPCAMVYDKSALNNCNYIFSFDRNVVNELKTKNVKNIHYMPLATTLSFVKTKVSSQYLYDVSFVGSTYEKMLGLYNQCMNVFPEYLKGYLNAVIDAQLLLDGSYILEDSVSDETESMLKTILNLDLGEGYLKSYKSFFANYVLGAKVTQLQRISMLNCLSEHFKVDLFTGDYNGELLRKELNVHNQVKYGPELANVYANSKINLNMTMANIQQGIPLRVFDIMGSGGFVMTNYRPGIEEHFTDGEDISIYYNTSDLINKIDYYLTHEDERKEIAENGKRKILSEYMVENKIKDIFSIVERNMVE